jgi:O-antigen ligase
MAGWAVTQVSIYASGTRGTLIAALLAAPLVLFPGLFRQGLRSRALLSSVVVGGLILMAFEAIRSSDDPALDATRTFLRLDREDVLDTRRSLWEASVGKGMERPLLGRGLGSSSYFWMDDASMEQRSAAAMRETGRVTVHNQFVEVFYESGILGVVAFSSLCVWAGWGALHWLEFGLRRRRMECIFLGLAWLGMGLGMFSHGGLTTSGNPGALLFWLNTLVVGVRPELVFARAKRRVARAQQLPGSRERRAAKALAVTRASDLPINES